MLELGRDPPPSSAHTHDLHCFCPAVVLKVIVTCIAVGYSAPGVVGPRHLDHWNPAGFTEQSEVASNSKNSKYLWVSRGRIEEGANGHAPHH